MPTSFGQSRLQRRERINLEADLSVLQVLEMLLGHTVDHVNLPKTESRVGLSSLDLLARESLTHPFIMDERVSAEIKREVHTAVNADPNFERLAKYRCVLNLISVLPNTVEVLQMTL